MKKLLITATLLLSPFSTYAVNLSNMQYIVLINESNDVIKGSFREEQTCNDEGHVTGNLSLEDGVKVIPNYDSNEINYVTSISDGYDYQCTSLNDNSKSDDIVYGGSCRDGYYGCISYDPGGSQARPIVNTRDGGTLDADFCYVEDEDGIDGNDDKYVYPTYADGTLTIHITDSAPPSDLAECK